MPMRGIALSTIAFTAAADQHVLHSLADYKKRISRYTDIQAESFELKQQVNRSGHAATAEQEIRFLKQELCDVKNKLAQRETELRSVQEQYEDVSAEYQRLFTCLRT